MTNSNTVSVNAAKIVKIVTAGPQGPAGPAGEGLDLDSTGKVAGSVLYYDSTAAKFKADATRTVENLVDGGNF